VKYDRPVWKLMHDCADAMPESFRYEDVRDWFMENYPNVNEATIRAHLIGLTDGGRAKHVQFAARAPIFRRVARGEYTPIPPAERGENPNGEAKAAGDAKSAGKAGKPEHGAPASSAVSFMSRTREPNTIVLLAADGDQASVPGPARDVFRGVAYRTSRAHAEAGGSRWFVLSADYGLVEPEQWVSPSSLSLLDISTSMRDAWAHWVVSRLEMIAGSVNGVCVRIEAPGLDAPDALGISLLDSLHAHLAAAGADVVIGHGSGPAAYRHGPIGLVAGGGRPVADVVPIRRAQPY
jgi:hypothetical protein